MSSQRSQSEDQPEGPQPFEVELPPATSSGPGGHRNPAGRNQYKNCPSKKDPKFQELLREYHRQTTNRDEVCKLLERDHGICVSDRTVSRRWKELGLKASAKMEEDLSESEVVKIVSDQITLESSTGKPMIWGGMKKRIALRTGIHLKRGTVVRIRKSLVENPETNQNGIPASVLATNGDEPQSQSQPQPQAQGQTHLPTNPVIQPEFQTEVPIIIDPRPGFPPLQPPVYDPNDGPNQFWCCERYGDLQTHGFVAWGIRDSYSQKMLGLWALPQDRVNWVSIGYMWLTMVAKVGGIPNQLAGEDSVAHRLSILLKESMSSEEDPKEAAQLFLEGIRLIPSEIPCYDTRDINLEQTFPFLWDPGSVVYKDNKPIHRRLAMTLWPDVIQRELEKYRVFANGKRLRRIDGKIHIVGVTRNTAFATPEKFKSQNFLHPLDSEKIKVMLKEMESVKDSINDFSVPREIAEISKDALRKFGVKDVTTDNVWLVFAALLSFYNTTTGNNV